MINLKKRTFEDFLQERHANIFPTLLDDDMPDHFDDWIGEQDGANMMDFAELYGKEQYLAGKEEMLKLI